MKDNGLVLACTVEECSYWNNRECHANNISVGESHPMCDTYTTMTVNQSGESTPEVAACMVQQCKYNSSNDECMAPGITVGHHAEHADCDTYVPKQM